MLLAMFNKGQQSTSYFLQDLNNLQNKMTEQQQMTELIMALPE